MKLILIINIVIIISHGGLLSVLWHCCLGDRRYNWPV